MRTNPRAENQSLKTQLPDDSPKSCDRRHVSILSMQLSLLLLASLAVTPPQLSGQCLPPPDGLVGWWRGEAKAGDWAGDAHGTNQGGVFFTIAQVGHGFTFDSDADRVVIPHRDAFNPGVSGFTVQFWMKGNKNQPGLCGLVGKSHGYVSPGAGWAFSADPGGSPAGQVSFAQFGASAPILSSVDVLDDQWHHVSGTWDGESTARLYVDGFLRGTAALTTPANNTRSLNLGFCWGGGAAQRFFRGQLDEVAIHNRALSSDEIAAVYAAGSAGMCSSGPPIIVLHPTIKRGWNGKRPSSAWRLSGASRCPTSGSKATSRLQMMRGTVAPPAPRSRLPSSNWPMAAAIGRR